MVADPFGIYGGGSTTTTPAPKYKTSTGAKNAGVRYDPFKIDSVAVDATPAPKVQQPAQPKVQSEPKQSKSFLNKFVSGAKGFASAASTGEQKFSQGIARVLPGGTNDLKAEEQSSQADQNTGKTYANLLKAGKISKAKYQKATAQVASNANKTSAEVKKTEKSMPTTAQVALGAASTAADIATAGTYGEATKIGKTGQVLKASKIREAEKAIPVAKGVKQVARGVVPIVAGNAAAGGLNAAAGGGDKGTIIKNAVAGAALPEVLHQGAGLTKTVGGKIVNKVSTKPAKELITNVKTQNLLEQMATKQGAKKSKSAVAELPTLELPAKHIPTAEPLVTSRPVDQIKTDIQTNSDHVKTITGKNPNNFIETTPKGGTKIAEGTPKDIKPYIEQHQALQKEYVQATTPGNVTGASEAPTTPTATATEKVAPESKSAIQPGLAKNEESVSSANNTPVASSPEPVRGTSKIAQDIQTQAVKRGLKNSFGEAGGYNKLTIEDQAKKAVALTNDRPALDKVISGEAPLPDGLRATALIKAVENHPELGKDPEVIRKLSQAEHLTGESSRSAQELRLAAERSPTSPVEAAKAIRQARAAALERRTGKSANSHITKDVNAALAAKPKVTPQTWSEFIDSIKC